MNPDEIAQWAREHGATVVLVDTRPRFPWGSVVAGILAGLAIVPLALLTLAWWLT